MMKAYYNRYTVAINGKEYVDCSGTYLTEETEIDMERTIEVNWNNLAENYSHFGIFLPFNIWRFKKGRIISFFNPSLFDKRTWDIKERKNPNFTFTIKIEAIEDTTLSINDILDYPVVEKAMKYLAERNIKISK